MSVCNSIHIHTHTYTLLLPSSPKSPHTRTPPSPTLPRPTQPKRAETKVDDLTNWRAVYEKQAGLQELRKDNTRLKDETRRLNRHIEQLTSTLGTKVDANDRLEASFARLKMEAGKPASFCYPELELSAEMLGERARVTAQLTEVGMFISCVYMCMYVCVHMYMYLSMFMYTYT